MNWIPDRQMSHDAWQGGFMLHACKNDTLIFLVGEWENRLENRKHRNHLDFFPVSNVTSCEVSGLVDGVPYAFFGHSLGALVAYETARLGRGREIIWNFVTNYYHTISPSSWVYLLLDEIG